MSTGATLPAARRAPLPELAKIPPDHIVGERRKQLAALLKRHYDERGVSTRALAAEIGRSQKFVWVLLEEAGSTSPRKRIRGEDRKRLSELLRKRYEEEGVSILALAAETGRSRAFISSLLSEAGITFHPVGNAYLKGVPPAEWTPENRKAARANHRRLCLDLRRRYEQGVSEDRLANETGQSRDRIRELLIEAGTTFRGPVITDYTAEGRQRRLIEESARQWAYGALAKRYRHLFSELFVDACTRAYEVLGMTYDPRGDTSSGKGIFGVHDDEASTASEAHAERAGFRDGTNKAERETEGAL